jgi:hypothetical protein
LTASKDKNDKQNNHKTEQNSLRTATEITADLKKLDIEASFLTGIIEDIFHFDLDVYYEYTSSSSRDSSTTKYDVLTGKQRQVNYREVHNSTTTVSQTRNCIQVLLEISPEYKEYVIIGYKLDDIPHMTIGQSITVFFTGETVFLGNVRNKQLLENIRVPLYNNHMPVITAIKFHDDENTSIISNKYKGDHEETSHLMASTFAFISTLVLSVGIFQLINLVDTGKFWGKFEIAHVVLFFIAFIPGTYFPRYRRSKHIARENHKRSVLKELVVLPLTNFPLEKELADVLTQRKHLATLKMSSTESDLMIKKLDAVTPPPELTAFFEKLNKIVKNIPLPNFADIYHGYSDFSVESWGINPNRRFLGSSAITEVFEVVETKILKSAREGSSATKGSSVSHNSRGDISRVTSNTNDNISRRVKTKVELLIKDLQGNTRTSQWSKSIAEIANPGDMVLVGYTSSIFKSVNGEETNSKDQCEFIYNLTKDRIIHPEGCHDDHRKRLGMINNLDSYAYICIKITLFIAVVTVVGAFITSSLKDSHIPMAGYAAVGYAAVGVFTLLLTSMFVKDFILLNKNKKLTETLFSTLKEAKLGAKSK